MFRPASTPEIIRSHQKDDYYLSLIRSTTADIVQRIAGPLRWLQWRKELDVASDSAYFILTTFGGYQTVGEEYVNVILVDGSKRRLPSKLVRGVMVGLQVLSPYLLHLALDKLERRLQRGLPLPIDLTGPERDKLLQVIPALRHAVTIIHRAHLSLFYVQGAFYHLAKRFTGISYVRYMAKKESYSISHPFRLLGYLSLAQLAVSSGLQLYSAWRAGKESHAAPDAGLALAGDDIALHPSMKCSLCLGPRRRSTLTICGHLFCWDCIHHWCQQKAECPLCRQQFPPHRLVPLHNYDPS